MIQFTEIQSSFNISWGYKIDPIYRIVGKNEHLDDFSKMEIYLFQALKISKVMMMKCKVILVKVRV